MGAMYVNNFNEFGRYWQVNLMADPNYRNRVNDVLDLKVRNRQGEMIPLASLMSVRNVGGPVMVMRFNLFEAAPVAGMQSPRTSTGQLIDIIKEVGREELPEAMTYEWSEIVYLQIIAGNTAFKLFALGVVLVFLVLAALYESWALPLAVILVVPMCLLCSLAGLMIAFLPIDILAQVGLVVLVGLASKNAILIVEFAKQQRDQGMSRREATLEACKLRLRPIMMTSFAFILGVVPLMLAEGAGAEMRHSLGTTVFSGMVGVTFFGIFLTPVFFYRITGLAEDAVRIAGLELRVVARWLLYAVAFCVFGYMAPRFLETQSPRLHQFRLLNVIGLTGHQHIRTILEFVIFGSGGMLFVWLLSNLSSLVRRQPRPTAPSTTMGNGQSTSGPPGGARRDLALFHRSAHFRGGAVHPHHAGGRPGDLHVADRPVSRHHSADRRGIDASIPGPTRNWCATPSPRRSSSRSAASRTCMYMSSQCTNDGRYRLIITFKLGTDPNMAQVLTQNRVSLALPIMPDLVQREGVSVLKKSPSTMMIVNLISPDQSRYDNLYLSNYATIQIRDELLRLEGVGDVTFLGQRDYSMRAWLDPEKMATLNLTASDVVRRVQQQNLQVAAGQVGQQPVPKGQNFQLTINTLGRL